MRRCIRSFFFPCLFLFCLPQLASAAVFEQWQSLTLAGEKIGHRHTIRKAHQRTLLTRETLELHTRVPGERPTTAQTILEYDETEGGEPLAIRKTVKNTQGDHQMFALVRGRRLLVGIEGQRGKGQVFRLPADFLLPEGVRLTLLNSAKTNNTLVYSSWSFTQQGFKKNTLKFSADNSVPGSSWKITRSAADETEEKDILYADNQFNVIREYTNSGGDALVAISCDKACATSELVPLENVYRQLIKSPYRITEAALRGKVRYTLRLPSSWVVPNSYEQRAEWVGEELRVTVCRDCGVELPPSKAELQQAVAVNYWLDHGAPEIQAVVDSLLAKSHLDAGEKMQRLTRFVTRHMKKGDIIYSGYATAAQALASTSGDCTEQALLLAALGRAAKVPTRVAIGVVYSNERFYGKNYVFVPHAWVQAWVDERWVSYDSGMEGFTSGHILLGVSNGGHAEFLQVSEQLHGLKILTAAQLKNR